VLVLDQFIAQRLLEVGRSSAQLRQPIDRVHDQVVTVQVIQYEEEEPACGRTTMSFSLPLDN
jgi:hypothetical protein